MSLVSLTVTMSDRSTVTVTGDQVSPHFAVTPAVARRSDGTVGLATDGRVLTHIPTGIAVTSDPYIPMDRFAAALEALPIDWAHLALPITRDLRDRIKDLHRRLWEGAGRERPWPEWVGRVADPARSLLVEVLDQQLEEKVPLFELTRTYGLAYLLGVLMRVDPAAADRAARHLTHMWAREDEAAGEDLYRWRQALAEGRPLRLPGGFPDLPVPAPKATPAEALDHADAQGC
ncbi:hypothetical protein [Nocardia paucivorans]|uniref:hypothetical protein n=1 Tax=Nocardia paucivorans TaxID=114259 RepID=UPI00059337C9|nr:hypothetical protein [Nocardia paucivorans]